MQIFTGESKLTVKMSRISKYAEIVLDFKHVSISSEGFF